MEELNRLQRPSHGQEATLLRPFSSGAFRGGAWRPINKKARAGAAGAGALGTAGRSASEGRLPAAAAATAPPTGGSDEALFGDRSIPKAIAATGRRDHVS